MKRKKYLLPSTNHYYYLDRIVVKWYCSVLNKSYFYIKHFFGTISLINCNKRIFIFLLPIH